MIIPPVTPDDAQPFWGEREVLSKIHQFARARLAAPWGVLGCVLVRVVASVPPQIRLPAIVGGHASLNLYAGLVGAPGAGKGAAFNVSAECIDLPPIATFGPGSGEGLLHLYARRPARQEQEQYRKKVLLWCPEVETINALRGRQASTLFAEVNKAWMGEPLGFAYADSTRALSLLAHSYRLGLVVGIQPGKAGVLLDDADAGTPQRYLWMQADDPEAPDVTPETPGIISNPLWRPGGDLADDNRLGHVMDVCAIAAEQIREARKEALRGHSDGLNQHSLLCQLKVAAALALLDSREDVTEEDWDLAGVVMEQSNYTRQAVIDEQARAKALKNRQHAHAEAEREIIKLTRVEEHNIQRIGRSLMTKMNGSWVAEGKLKHLLHSRDRHYFQDALEALVLAERVQRQEDPANPRTAQFRKVT